LRADLAPLGLFLRPLEASLGGFLLLLRGNVPERRNKGLLGAFSRGVRNLHLQKK